MFIVNHCIIVFNEDCVLALQLDTYCKSLEFINLICVNQCVNL